MNEQKKNTIQSRLPRLELSNKPTLYITKKLKRQIDYLHSKVGKAEWSGELITREEGVITELDSWKVIAEDIFLVDIGSSAYTEYEVDKGGFKSADIVQMYDSFPGMLEGTHKNHHVHSHQSFGCFFSGTDWSQLEDRGVIHNYFIMLIVNFAGDWIAKCAFKGKRKITTSPTLEFSNNTDGYAPFTLNAKDKDEEVLVVMDMEVVIPKVEHSIPLGQDVRVVMEELSKAETADEGHLEILLEYLNDCVKNKSYLVDEPFRLRYEAVVKALEEEKSKTKVYTPGFNSGNNYGGYNRGTYQQGSLYGDDEYGYGGYDWESEYEWKDGKYQKKETHIQGKKIGEMTDKEFNQFQQEESTIKWDIEDVKILLNACITGTWWEDKITSPINEFKKLSKKLKARDKREDWMEEFRMDIGSKVYQMWDQSLEVEPQDALNLLQMCLDYLKEERKDKFFDGVCQQIEAEMKFVQEEAEYYKNYPVNQRGGYA